MTPKKEKAPEPGERGSGVDELYNCVGPAAAQRQGRHGAQPAPRGSKSRLGADVDWIWHPPGPNGIGLGFGRGAVETWGTWTGLLLNDDVSVSVSRNVLVISCPSQ